MQVLSKILCAFVSESWQQVFLRQIQNLHDIVWVQFHFVAVNETKQLQQAVIPGEGGGVGYFQEMGYWGCAAGWGRIYLLAYLFPY